MIDRPDFPPFHPHPLFRGGHAQTLAGAFLPSGRIAYRATRHVLPLGDGDRLVLHDDCPPEWTDGGPVALLLHGLAGCHQSGYMVRIASKLRGAGVRTFRMDHRDCGAGAGMARLPYHAGRSDDALAAVHWIANQCPGSPIGVAGFSLSGNIVLKLLGEAPDEVPRAVARAIAINPSLDLLAAVRFIDRPLARFYDRHFVSLLNRQVRARNLRVPDAERFAIAKWPRKLYDFDDAYTAPVAGFGTAAEYYRRCSASQFVTNIRVPTVIVTSRDDPLVPVASFEALTRPENVSLVIAESGGHLGYVARRGSDPDCRWMDWRVVDWLSGVANGHAAHAVAANNQSLASTRR